MKRLKTVTTLVLRAANTDVIYKSVVKRKVRYLKTHVVAICSTFAQLGLKNLSDVIMVNSITALHATAIVRVAMIAPNSFDKSRNVALRRVASQNRYVPSQCIQYSCHIQATVNISMSASTALDRANVAHWDFAGTLTWTYVTKHFVLRKTTLSNLTALKLKYHFTNLLVLAE
jgi:hypothetical protein